VSIPNAPKDGFTQEDYTALRQADREYVEARLTQWEQTRSVAVSDVAHADKRLAYWRTQLEELTDRSSDD